MEYERLTWNEIVQKYPHQWVGLVDVKFKNDDGVSIESGIVKYTSKDTSEEELFDMAVVKKEIVRRYTTMYDAPQMGFLTF